MAGKSDTEVATNNNNNNNKTPDPIEYNPRWKGYSFMMLSALINFATLSGMQPDDNRYVGNQNYSWLFGSVQFLIALAILVTDRLQLFTDYLDYKEAWDGHLEGYTLMAACVWSIVGVAFLTQVQGIAYLVLNVYCSAWLMLFSCVYTLNDYSGSRDILTIAELTSVSATLKSWWVLFLSSLVVAGTSLNVWVVVSRPKYEQASLFGVAIGCISSVVAMWNILWYYQLLPERFCCSKKASDWMELAAIFGMVVLWIVGVSVLTTDGGIATTIVGTVRQPDEIEDVEDIFMSDDRPKTQDAIDDSVSWNYTNSTIPRDPLEDCIVLVRNVTYNCSDWLETILFSPAPTTFPTMSAAPSTFPTMAPASPEPHYVPGSNLYLAAWTCLLSSLNLILRWKAQQALQFANTQQQQATMPDDDSDNEEEEDDDDDLEEYDDANESF